MIETFFFFFFFPIIFVCCDVDFYCFNKIGKEKILANKKVHTAGTFHRSVVNFLLITNLILLISQQQSKLLHFVTKKEII